MSDLASKHCVPCSGGVPPLTSSESKLYLHHLSSNWQIVNNHHLTRTFTFKDFRQALAFTNRVGEIAEAEGHHPDIYLSWGKVELTLFTHKIDGLTESDFILSAKIDKLPTEF